MPKTTLTTVDVQEALTKLGYYDGPADGDEMDENYRSDLKRFQSDYGLTADGWYGAKSEAKLLPLITKLHDVMEEDALFPVSFKHLCRWTLTHYYISDQKLFANKGNLVP